RALEQVLHHARRAVARARRPAGRISALAFPKLGHSPHSSAGFGVWGAGRRRPATLPFGAPRHWGPKKPGRFWGAPPPRNEKPGAVSRAGLGHTPEGYLFILESRFNVQKSEVASHKLHRNHKLHHAQVVFGIPRNICWAPPRVGVRPMKNSARFPGR